MPKLFDDVMPSGQGLKGKSVEELLLLIGDEEKGFKPEAMDILLGMGVEANYQIYERAVRNDTNADLRNSAMELLVKFGNLVIPRLIKLLRDDNEEVRNFSCVMLGDIGSRESVGALIQALGDHDINVSHSAAEALGKIGDRAALLPLTELLKSEFWLQYAAITAIGAMKDYRAVPHLLQLLENELLAKPVIEALGKIGDPRALYPLSNLFADLDDSLAGEVAKAIVAIYRNLNETLSYKNSLFEYSKPDQLRQLFTDSGVVKLRGLLRICTERDSIDATVTLLGWIGEISALDDFFGLLDNDTFVKSVESAILAMGKRSVERLVAALSDSNENVRIVAIRSLRWLGVACDITLTRELLASSVQAIQLEVLESLRDLTYNELLPVLFDKMQHGPDELSLKTAEVLAAYPYQSLRDFLFTLCHSPEPVIRMRVATLLGYLKDCGAADLIAVLVLDDDIGVRTNAVRAIGQQQLKSAIPLLQQALSDPDDNVREEALAALAEFRDPTLLPFILELLGTSGESLDYAVTKGIGTIGSSDGGAALFDYLEKGNLSRRLEYAVIETLGKISFKPASGIIADRYLCSPDPDIRRLAVETLGNLGDQYSLREVETAAHDHHWSVRIAALHVLGKIGGTKEIQILIAAMDDPDYLVRKHAVLTLGDLRNITTVPELVKQLTDMEMSRYAFEAVLKFGRSSLPWLHRLMKKDYSLDIRERVVDLIGKIGDRKSVEPLMELLDDPSPTIRLAAIDSLAFCFDSVLIKKLMALKKGDANAEVQERADLALKTFTTEKFY